MFPLRDSHGPGIFPFVTYTIIVISCIAFYLQLTAPDTQGFTETWSLVASRVNFGDITSLIPFVTSIFLHGGFLHIASNMWFLHIYGDNVEADLGPLGYLLFYLGGGVFAAFVQYLFMIGSDIPSLGASGAIAAVMGYYVVRFPFHTITSLVFLGPVATTARVPAPLVLVLWFVTQLLSGTASIADTAQTGGVAWWAHIGGFAFGVVVALLISPFRRSRE